MEFLDTQRRIKLIWLHGTAGVGKSAVAFTVAERMRGLKVIEETNVEKWLAGMFFFSRKHTKWCTARYFFATLVYQLATNFPSIRKDMSTFVICYDALDECPSEPELTDLIFSLAQALCNGKCAVAFTVAERMKGLKVTEETNVKNAASGSILFLLATNFPSIRQDVNRAIRNNHALLDPDTPLCNQMEGPFSNPSRNFDSDCAGVSL
ncbi:hypothetical protein DFJ58DRAFT_846100 [Suillus subalutaceus]|uniref:uncharacterized protein n=1 Tax=Suillus subalutaceus TaxID=48586 RepID=UPI001B864B05|nr:uncharacterized protein DFJ58DRAFT_846100 [Suillus subalutaceus]KAG1838387.1 hypothetical protein DFJ58DRAFT_846100 [Suillus subalutaceus]